MSTRVDNLLSSLASSFPGFKSKPAVSKKQTSHSPLATKVDGKAKELASTRAGQEASSDESPRVWKIKMASSPCPEFPAECIESFSKSLAEHEQADLIFARFLFLYDKKPKELHKAFVSKTFADFTLYLETETKNALRELFNKFHPQKTKIANIFSYHGLIYEIRYVLEIAKILLRSNGTLNSGLIDDIKEHLLIKGSKATSLDTHLIGPLDDLKTPALQAALEKIGEANEEGKQNVRATLCLPADTPITSAHVRTTALANFLHRFRHLDYHNCYAYSVSLTTKVASPAKALEEFGAILEKGALTRVIDGKECTFVATSKMTRSILGYELNKGVTAQKLWEHPHFALAFQTAGANLQAVTQAMSAISRRKEALTLDRIFKQLKTQMPKIAQDAHDVAYFIAASVGDMSLSRRWNSAIAGMFFTPFTTKYQQIVSHDIFKASLLRTLISLLDATKDPSSNTLLPLLSKLIPDLAKAEMNEEDIKKALQNGGIDLTAPHFKALEDLRIFAEPPSALSRHYAECCLYQKKGATFTKITSLTEFGAVLKGLFGSILSKMKGGKCASLIEKLPCKEIAEKFQAFFTSFLLCEDVGTFDADYDNTPWCFKLAPSYFDTFWSVYFDAPKIDAPSFTINFSENHNGAKELLEWAQKIRMMKGCSPKLAIPAKYPGKFPNSAYPGHAFLLTPNHPTMVPKDNQSVEDALQEKMDVVKQLTFSKAKNALQEAKTWAIEYLK